MHRHLLSNHSSDPVHIRRLVDQAVLFPTQCLVSTLKFDFLISSLPQYFHEIPDQGSTIPIHPTITLDKIRCLTLFKKVER